MSFMAFMLFCMFRTDFGDFVQQEKSLKIIVSSYIAYKNIKKNIISES